MFETKEYVFQSRRDVHNIIAVAFCKGEHRNQTRSNPRKAWHFSPYLYLVDTQNISTFSSGFLNFNSYTVEPKTMKKVIGSICLALFCLGVIGVEYEIALYFGSVLILFASVAFLGALLIAVFRAPEGYEWLDGFHICQCDPASRHVRGIRLFRRARAVRSR